MTAVMLNYKKRNLLQKLSTDADQVEIQAARLGSATIETGLQDEYIANAMDDFGADVDGPEWVEKDLANDDGAGGILSEILRRINTLGECYPFKLEENCLTYKPDHPNITYKFCLTICESKSLTKKPYTLLPRAFEQLSKELTKYQLGPFANAMHTGWPRQDENPVAFRRLAEELHANTGEWHWQPQAGLDDNDTNRIKDEGLDFIVWLKSPDNRPGQLFITGQCACGNDWSTKFHDISIKRLSKWFHPATWVKPVKAFCTPYALVDGYLMEASQEAGLVFDRFRLAKLAETYENSLSQDLIGDMKECIDLVLKNQ